MMCRKTLVHGAEYLLTPCTYNNQTKFFSIFTYFRLPLPGFGPSPYLSTLATLATFAYGLDLVDSQ